jgi:hypothetical protein
MLCYFAVAAGTQHGQAVGWHHGVFARLQGVKVVNCQAFIG